MLRGAVEGENKQEEQKAENAATEAEKAAEESDEPELDPAAAMVAPTAVPDAGGGLRQPCPVCRPAFCGLHGIQRCVVVLLLPDRHGTDMCRYGLDRMGQSGRQLSFRKPQPGSDRSGVSVLGVLFFRLLCLRFVRFFRLSDGLSLMRRGLFLRSEVQPRRPLHWAISWGFVVMMRYSSVSFGKWSTKGMMVFP